MNPTTKLHCSLIVILVFVLNISNSSKKFDLASYPKGNYSCIQDYRYDLNELVSIQTTLSVLDRIKSPFRMNINCKYPSLFLMYMIILQCGDVEVHPGPRNIKFPCGVCNKRVSWNSKALQCDGCDIWYHTKCTSITDSLYSIYGKSSLTWLCLKCGIPNVSTSHTIDISFFETTNMFNDLNSPNQPTMSTPLKQHPPKPLSDTVCMNVSSVSSHKGNKQHYPSATMNNPPSLISSHANSIVSDPDLSSLSSGLVQEPSNLDSNLSRDSLSIHQQNSQTDLSFNILVVNFQSIRNKKLELHHVLTSLNPDIILGSETHLNPTIYDAEIFPHNIDTELVYKVFRKDRDSNNSDKKGGGGVVIMVKPSYDCEECQDLNVDCELLWVKVTTPHRTKFLVGAFYREPKSQLDILDKLNTSLGMINNNPKYKNCIVKLGGDFNLGDIDWANTSSLIGARDKAHCDKLCTIARDHLLEQINTIPTRKGRILDLLFTSHPNTIIKHTTCPPIGMSDHDILQVNTTQPHAPNKRESRSVHIYKKANWEQIENDLSSFSDNLLLNNNSQNIETIWNDFKQTILSTMKNNIPTKSLRKKADLPWMSSEIRKLIRKRDKMHKRLRSSVSTSLQDAYSNIKREIKFKMRSAYHDYLNDMLNPEQDNQSKNFWKFIKSRKQDSSDIGTLKKDGIIADTAQKKADILNSQFTSVFTQEDLTNLPIKGKSPFRPMANIYISLKGIINSITRLNEKKASGPDKIPIIILKRNCNVIAPVLQRIFQISLDTGKVPTDWKTANVVPIFKKGDRSKPANYRPVSLTSVISKMLEHIVVSNIMNHLDSQNILLDNQHGFRQKRSCETQLLLTTDDLSKQVNAGNQVDMAILDFSKAFDKVSHQRLSSKLDFYGISKNTRQWINCFLSNRTQRVTVQDATSAESKVTSGVPQGTVLGPCLFLLYINDITENISSTVRLFADDCVVYRPIHSPSDQKILQQDLNKLTEWSDLWQMEFNVKKCAIMNVSNSSNKKHFNYTMKGEILETVKQHPYLGVELSDNLKYNTHIDKITSKASQTLGFIKRNLKQCPAPVKERAYQTLVRPKLEYSSTIWNPKQQTQIKQIEQIQRNAARFVAGKPFNPNHPDSVTSILKSLQWPSLQSRRQRSDVIFLYRVVHQLVSVPASYLPNRALVHSTRQSNTWKFIQPHCRVNAYQHSFFPRTIPVWNMLPTEAVTAPSLDAFKDSIQLLPAFQI